MCCYVLTNRNWGIVTVPGFIPEQATGGAPTIENRWHHSSPYPLLNDLGCPDPHPSPNTLTSRSFTFSTPQNSEWVDSFTIFLIENSGWAGSTRLFPLQNSGKAGSTRFFSSENRAKICTNRQMAPFGPVWYPPRTTKTPHSSFFLFNPAKPAGSNRIFRNFFGF